MMKQRRTARSDSKFVIYQAVADNGDSYIGLTRKGERTIAGAVKERWRKHVSRAKHEDRQWKLYTFLKAGGLAMTWEHRVLAIVQGRAEAYSQERDLVKLEQPTLNDQYI